MTSRVYLVDDSAVIRGLIGRIIDSDPELAIAGTAANGELALKGIPGASPDLVVLDVEMPVMDGLETLRRLHAEHPSIPVVMFSTKTERGAAATVEALSLGAADYATKPSAVGGRAPLDSVKDELLTKIKALVGSTPAPAQPMRPAAPRRPLRTRLRAPSAIAVASSTGGPAALETVLSSIDKPLPVPVFVAQHMPPLFTSLLADRLDKAGPSTVVEVAEPVVAQPGTWYLAAGGRHMIVAPDDGSGQIRLLPDDQPPIRRCRPSADLLFETASRRFGSDLLSVVLSGMGADGSVGAEEVVASGGRVVAQDEASSVVWGMPGSVVRNGTADTELSLDEVGPWLASQCSAVLR